MAKPGVHKDSEAAWAEGALADWYGETCHGLGWVNQLEEGGHKEEKNHEITIYAKAHQLREL